MAVYRGYRKRSTQRRKTLSNYRIATRTSARSQAKQIYALKRRINVIQKRTKPEIKTIRRVYTVPSNFNTTRSDSSILSVVQDNSEGVDTLGPYFLIPLVGVNSDTQLDVNNNNFARQLSFRLTGSIIYAGSPTLEAVPFVMRMVVLQTRSTRTEAIGPDDVFSATGSPGVFGPLQTGLARTCKVLADRRFYLSYQRPIVRINVIMKRLLNYYRDSNRQASSGASDETIPKGAITVVVLWNKLSTTVATGDLPAITLNLNGKLAYTDA